MLFTSLGLDPGWFKSNTVGGTVRKTEPRPLKLYSKYKHNLPFSSSAPRWSGSGVTNSPHIFLLQTLLKLKHNERVALLFVFNLFVSCFPPDELDVIFYRYIDNLPIEFGTSTD
jgi:hypothetical protein